MKGLVLLLLPLVFWGCNTTPTKSKYQRLLDLKNKFPHQHLTSFKIPDGDWENLLSKFTPVDSGTQALLWQGEKHDFASDSNYYYSWQSNDTNSIILTTILRNESDYCFVIECLVYNKDGEMTSHFSTAAECGDGGWIYSAQSKIDGNNNYVCTSVETNYGGEDSLTSTEINEGDSVIIEYSITPKGLKNEVIATFPIRHLTPLLEYQPQEN